MGHSGGHKSISRPSTQPIELLRDDAKSLYEILVDPNKGAYDKEQVQLMTDDEHLPTRTSLMTALNSASRAADEEDTILFAFSGHGIEKDESSYLLPIDARTALMTDTSIPLRWVKEELGKSQARANILILDACHAGAMIGKTSLGPMTKTFSEDIFGLSEGFATLSSCKFNEVSYEWKEKQHSVFTYYLVEGLNGAADEDNDGWITVPEASKYVALHVKEWAFKQGYQQSPTLEYRVSGEIALVKTVKPAQVPVTIEAEGVMEQYVTSIILMKGAGTGDICSFSARLLTYYDVDELVNKDGVYHFPDGSYSTGTGEIPHMTWAFILQINYQRDRRDFIATLIRDLSAGQEWSCVKFIMNRQFDLRKMVRLLKASNIQIESLHPGKYSEIDASAPGWGTSGTPAKVRFRNIEGGASIRIVQYESPAGRVRLEDQFYMKLNPKVIGEFMSPALISPMPDEKKEGV